MHYFLFLAYFFLPHFCDAQLTIGDVFNFEVGDEFHIEPNYFYDTPTGYFKILIDKDSSKNGDTLFYTWQTTSYGSTWNDNSNKLEWKVNQPKEFKVFYTNLDSSIYSLHFSKILKGINDSFVILNKNINWDSLPEFGLIGDTITNYAENYCNSLCTRYDVSYGALQFEKTTESRVYGKGLGELEYSIFEDVGGTNGGSGWYVRYFKKGNVVCGSKMYNSLPNQSFSQNQFALCIYPNPTDGILYFKSDLNGLEYQIFGLDGRIKLSGILNNEIDIQNFPSGIYFIKISTEDSILNERFIIR